MADRMTIAKRQTNETLRSDMWRACDILRRDNNVGGVMQYTEHLAWLLFLKFLDEEEQERVAQAALGEGEPYEPVLQDDLIQFVRGRLRSSRKERASEFRLRERSWLNAHAEDARAVVLALVDKYVLGGLQEMTDPAVLRVSPFREMGEARGVLRRFGSDPQRFRATMTELQRRLYADAA